MELVHKLKHIVDHYSFVKYIKNTLSTIKFIIEKRNSLTCSNVEKISILKINENA
jgi:hypothetical protein